MQRLYGKAAIYLPNKLLPYITIFLAFFKRGAGLIQTGKRQKNGLFLGTIICTKKYLTNKIATFTTLKPPCAFV